MSRVSLKSALAAQAESDNAAQRRFSVMSDGDLPHSFTVPARTAASDRPHPLCHDRGNALLSERFVFSCRHPDGVEVLRIVATDGHRLVASKCRFRRGGGHAGVIVPRKAVGEIYKLIEEVEDDIEISLSETKSALPSATRC